MAQSFVGTWLVGLATSLPELVTSLAAVRMGAYDLNVSLVHAISALIAIVLMSVGLASIVYRSKSPHVGLEPSSALMLLVYFAGIWLVYLYGGM